MGILALFQREGHQPWTLFDHFGERASACIQSLICSQSLQVKMVDNATKKTLAAIPLLKAKAGPRDGDAWVQRLKEEYMALIKYVQNNKDADNDWFRLESNKEGTRWFGKCWYIHEMLKYEFDVEFDVPVTYPTTSPEIALPELDGKTAKMYRGGKICLTDHFKPLWA